MWTVGQFMSTLLYFWSLIAFNLLIDGKFAESNFQHVQVPTVHFSSLKAAVNESIDSVVDFNMSDLSRVYHGGNACPFKRAVLSKIAKSETVEILIVGGSVTYGADLKDRMKERWSTKFTEILSSGWYEGKLNIRNIGVGACNLDVWIDRVNEFKTADMVIIDLSVNDQGFDLQALPLLYHTFIQLIDSLPKHPAILVHYAFRVAQDDRRDVTDHCPLPSTQGVCCGGNYQYCQRWWEMQDFSAMTFNKLKIPFVSYRDLVWPDYAHPPPNLPVLWNGRSHPDFKAHRLIGKLIAFGFMMQLKDAHNAKDCESEAKIRYVTGSSLDLKIKPICPSPLTLMRATDEMSSWQSFPLAAASNSVKTSTLWPGESSSFVINGNNNWRFYNDSKSKFGWILETSSQSIKDSCAVDLTPRQTLPQYGDSTEWCLGALLNHTISLELSVSDDPVVQISYLKSYSPSMGRAAVWIDNFINETVFIDSKWDMRYSVTRVFTIVGREERLTAAANLTVSSALVGESAVLKSLSKASSLGGKHVLHISASPFSGQFFKWKLLGVASC